LAEQLVFALAEAPPPTLAGFVVGRNAEVVTALERAAAGAAADAILLWGGEGAGKTHLLQGFVAAAAVHGRRGSYIADANDLGGADAADAVAIDDVERADAAAQARLFTLFNALRARGGTFVAASRLPAAQLALRDDLRTRLAWGLTLEVRVLADADKPAALAAHARERGFALGDDVIAYLLAHGRRDMRSLMATLAALDRYSLSTRRAVTVPLLREWMTSAPLL
jgi:DnaA-homolog protein